MFLQVFFWLFLGALFLKIVANLLLPYRVIRLEEGEGVSIMFLLMGDGVLSALVMLTAWWIDKPDSVYSLSVVATAVGSGVLGSYAHYFVVLILYAWLQRFRKPQ